MHHLHPGLLVVPGAMPGSSLIHCIMNLVTVLEQTMSSSQKGIVFLQGAEGQVRLPYAGLWSAALRVLGSLQAKGLRAGDELVIQTDDQLQFVVLFWAGIMGGMIPVPLSTGTQEEQKRKLFRVWRLLGNPFLACDAEQYQRIAVRADDAEKNIHTRHLAIAELMAGETMGVLATIADTDTAYIQFSSGSTGEPKGVCLTHRNLLTNIYDIIEGLGITRADTLFNWMPLTHDMGLIGFHLTGIAMAIDAVSMPTALFIRRPLLWMEAVAAEQATVLYSPNFGLQYFLSALQRHTAFRADLSAVRIIVNGAEPIVVDLCHNFIASLRPYGLRENAILSAYGLAEAAVAVSAMPPGSPLLSYVLDRRSLNTGNPVVLVEDDSPVAVRFADAGFPMRHCGLRVCGDDDVVLPPGTIGHLQIKGENVTAGYYRQEAATQQLFTGDGWLRTGDLGFIRDGRLVVTGRHKNLIILNGQNYYPQDIEGVVIAGGLAEQGRVVACGNRDKDTGLEVLLLFVLYKGDALRFAPTANAIAARVLEQVGIPVAAVVPVARIPKTTSGKVQYFALLEQYRNTINLQGMHGADSPEAWGNIDWDNPLAVETCLLTFVQTLPGSPDKTASLTAAGMNSLSAMQLADRLTRFSGKAIAAELLFSSADITALSRHIALAGKGKPILPLPDESGKAAKHPSLAQIRMFAEYTIDSSSAAYHIPLVFRTNGHLDKGVLEKAINILVQRYETLRMAFRATATGTEVTVLAVPDAPFLLQYHDLRLSANREAEETAVIRALVSTPFELEKALVLRGAILQGRESEQVLVVVFHHICTDGWSLQIFFRELALLYDGLLHHPEAVLPEAPQRISYTQYAAWQQRLLDTGVLEKSRQYWLGLLKDCPAPVDFSGQPAAGMYTGAVPTDRYCCTLDENAVGTVKALAAKYRVSVFSVILAMLNTLLYRYTNRKDIVIGFDTAGRVPETIGQVFGYTLNTLCLRAAPDGQMTFNALLQQVHGQLMAALDHQLYPFEKLLEEMTGDSPEPRRPLFGVMVLLQNFMDADAPLLLGDAVLTRTRAATPHGFTDLLLEFEESRGCYLFSITCNTRRYTAEGIALLASHFRHLLAAVSENDGLFISRYDFLTPEEKQIHRNFNHHPFTARRLRLPVHVLFEKQVVLHPEAVAVYAGDVFLTYRELNERCNRIAHHLRTELPVSPDTCIAFRTGRNENILVAMLAILKTGAAFLAMDEEWPVDRCAQVVNDSKSLALLVDSETHPALQDSVAAALLVDIDDVVCWSGRTDNPVYTGAIENLAYLIYTSGTTGRPKGIMIEQGTLTDYVQYFIHYFGITARDVVMQQASVAFDTFIEEIFPAICAGGRVVIARAGGRDIPALLALIKQHAVSILSTTPLVLNEINYQYDSRISTLRLIISGGDVLQPQYVDQLFQNVSLYNTYGPSETTVCATFHQITALENAGVIGKPVGNGEVWILDEHLQPLPFGVPGELYIGGGLARGYFGQPELTARHFIPHPFAPGRRLYRSGDMAKLTYAGELVFAGRADDQVKIRGHRVELQEVENCLLQYPGIIQAAAVPEPATARLTGFVVAQTRIAATALHEFMHLHLPYYMVPVRFIFLAALPLTGNGKLDKKQLLERALLPDPQEPGLSVPLQPLEAGLLDIARVILQSPAMHAGDHFFAHGCTSVKAASFCSAIQKQLGCQATIRDVFLYPTVLRLAAIVKTQQPHQPAPLLLTETMDDYPLSPAQSRLWLLAQLQKESFAYHEAEWFVLTGALNPDWVKEVFGAIVRKYEVFRTQFVQREGIPRQIVREHDACPLAFTCTDVSTAAAPVEEAKAILDEALKQPFRLDEYPLYRIVLVKVETGQYWFSLVMHHIVTDDWSARIILADFFQYYHKLKQGQPLLVSVPLIQYRHYAAAQSAAPVEREGDRLYWQDLFSGSLPVLDLYPDRPRPVVKHYAGGVKYASFDTATAGAVQAFCQAQEVSLFMFLLSGVYVLLNRYSGQQDIVIGVPVSDRGDHVWHDVPGFFIHTLPLRLQAGPGCIADLLAKVKRCCLDALAHQSYPLESLLSDLRVQRNTGRAPLFDVIVNLNTTADTKGIADCGIHYERLPKTETGSKYDLEFYFEETVDGLSVALVYDKYLFDESRMTRMLDHLQNLLRELCADPFAAWHRLELLLHTEKELLLKTFNPVPVPQRNDTITERFSQQVAVRPGAAAVACGGRIFTYAEIDNQSNALAAALLNRYAIQPGQRIALRLDRGAEVITCILGVWKAGAVYVPLDPGMPDKRIARLLELSGVRLLITDQPQPLYPAATVSLADLLSGLPNGYAGQFLVLPVPDAERTAYVIFTSGSTGEPKGVEIRHASVSNLLDSLTQRVGMQPGQTMLSVSSYTFDISVSEFFLPLISGARVVIAAAAEVTNARLLCRLMAEQQPDLMQATPGLWSMLVDYGWEGNTGLTAITCGEPLGQVLRDRLLERTKALWNMYGPTETTIFSSGVQVTAADELITIGRPLDNTVMFILDDNLQLLPVGTPGQLYIGGAGVAAGYLNQPQLTADKFVQVPALYPGTLYATGDVARHRADGAVEYIGRADNQVKIRGYRVELGEIEYRVLQCPVVQAAAVLLQDGGKESQKIIAFVVYKDGADHYNTLNAYLRSHLPLYMLPARCLAVPVIPLTVNGKVDRALLLSQLLPASAAREQAVPPVTRTERILLELWMQLLDQHHIGTTDDFFDLGGHSLMANQLLNKIYHRFSVELLLSDIFLHSTIKQLGEKIEALEKEAYEFIDL